jgi:hypothetical protein
MPFSWTWLNQNVRLNKLPGWFMCILTTGKHCFDSVVLKVESSAESPEGSNNRLQEWQVQSFWLTFYKAKYLPHTWPQNVFLKPWTATFPGSLWEMHVLRHHFSLVAVAFAFSQNLQVRSVYVEVWKGMLCIHTEKLLMHLAHHFLVLAEDTEAQEMEFPSPRSDIQSWSP